jgi:WhiB family transcriptional regulator, redox-sensing transcriptional regulator
MTATLPLFTAAGDDWRDSALCAQADPNLFFPEKGVNAAEAKRICGRCEVRAECLAKALELPYNKDKFGGIRGGLSPAERYELRKATP